MTQYNVEGCNLDLEKLTQRINIPIGKEVRQMAMNTPSAGASVERGITSAIYNVIPDEIKELNNKFDALECRLGRYKNVRPLPDSEKSPEARPSQSEVAEQLDKILAELRGLGSRIYDLQCDLEV